MRTAAFAYLLMVVLSVPDIPVWIVGSDRRLGGCLPLGIPAATPLGCEGGDGLVVQLLE